MKCIYGNWKVFQFSAQNIKINHSLGKLRNKAIKSFNNLGNSVNCCFCRQRIKRHYFFIFMETTFYWRFAIQNFCTACNQRTVYCCTSRKASLSFPNAPTNFLYKTYAYFTGSQFNHVFKMSQKLKNLWLEPYFNN